MVGKFLGRHGRGYNGSPKGLNHKSTSKKKAGEEGEGRGKKEQKGKKKYDGDQLVVAREGKTKTVARSV
jgi:hypothetical protein